MMEDGVQCGSQKRIFRMTTGPVFVSTDCVLYILKPQYEYQGCSANVGDSNDLQKSVNGHTNRIILMEKMIFIDFQKWYPDDGKWSSMWLPKKDFQNDNGTSFCLHRLRSIHFRTITCI